MRKALLVLGVAVSIGWAGQAVAQTPNGFEEAVRQGEAEEKQRKKEEEWRTSGERNAANVAAAEARGRREMAAINTWPVLPAARNPLFGKWMIEASLRPKPKEDDFFGQLNAISSLTCRLMFSDGVVNFKPAEWLLDDSAGEDSLGPVTYRSNGKIIAVVPAKGINALAFEVENKDRMVELRTSAGQEPCVMFRVPETTTYATRPRAGRSASAQSARPAPGQQAANRAAPPAAAPPARSARGAAMRAAVDPRSPFGQAFALHQSGFQYQEALPKLLEATKATPNDARAHAYLADTYFRLGMPVEGRAAEARARQLDPGVFEMFN